jgi:hypothetical protein
MEPSVRQVHVVVVWRGPEETLRRGRTVNPRAQHENRKWKCPPPLPNRHCGSITGPGSYPKFVHLDEMKPAL